MENVELTALSVLPPHAQETEKNEVKEEVKEEAKELIRKSASQLSESLIDPQEILDKAIERAKLLKEIVDQRGLARKFGSNPKEYLEFEAWQLIGEFYGYTAIVSKTETLFNEHGAIFGFKSIAEVVDRAGHVVSRADHICTKDEIVWSTKPLAQILSMAQTRSCAKALRQRLAFVAILADYSPTPAVEIEIDMENIEKTKEDSLKIHDSSFLVNWGTKHRNTAWINVSKNDLEWLAKAPPDRIEKYHIPTVVIWHAQQELTKRTTEKVFNDPTVSMPENKNKPASQLDLTKSSQPKIDSLTIAIGAKKKEMIERIGKDTLYYDILGSFGVAHQTELTLDQRTVFLNKLEEELMKIRKQQRQILF